jgi:hypothetical protein
VFSLSSPAPATKSSTHRFLYGNQIVRLNGGTHYWVSQGTGIGQALQCDCLESRSLDHDILTMCLCNRPDLDRYRATRNESLTSEDPQRIERWGGCLL